MGEPEEGDAGAAGGEKRAQSIACPTSADLVRAGVRGESVEIGREVAGEFEPG